MIQRLDCAIDLLLAVGTDPGEMKVTSRDNVCPDTQSKQTQ